MHYLRRSLFFLSVQYTHLETTQFNWKFGTFTQFTFILQNSAHTAAMEKLWPVVLRLLICCKVLFGLLCLSAVVAGSDCPVPAPNDGDTDPRPPGSYSKK